MRDVDSAIDQKFQMSVAGNDPCQGLDPQLEQHHNLNSTRPASLSGLPVNRGRHFGLFRRGHARGMQLLLTTHT